jgi:hypothetical protein
MEKMIKILFLASDPRDVGYRPDLDKEFKEIKKSLRASKFREYFAFESELAVRPADLREALSRHEPDIVHYSGHGNEKGLVMQNNVGRRTLVSRRMLSELFKASKWVRLVLLNACYSDAQVEAVKETVDFTIGTNSMLLDRNAIAFAAAFYQELAAGRSVNDAFRLAKVDLTMQKVPRSKAPILHIRKGADANSPFFERSPSRARPAKSRQPSKAKTTGGIDVRGDSIKSTLIIGDHANMNNSKRKR